MVNINKKSFNFRQNADFNIPDQALVTVTDMGHIQEVQYLEKVNKQATIKKLSATEYVVLTGEDAGVVKEFQSHSDTRAENIAGVRRTLKTLRYLINTNFRGGQNELFITLTYKECMTDTKTLYGDFKRFIQRLKWKLKTQLEYINVIEPQGRGAWHCHLLLKAPQQDILYIANKDLAEIWGKGFVSVRRLSNVDNIGAYLSAYLADIELNEETPPGLYGEVIDKEVQLDDGTIQTKRYIKGGRLPLYPVGVQIYRKSKGIAMPPRYEAVYETIKKGIASVPDYAKSVELLEDDEHYNTIAYEYYNLKRRNCQGETETPDKSS